MNIPTRLTVFRIIVTFITMGLLSLPGPYAKGAGLALCVVAAVTDWWDGYLARRLNQITPMGALLDPIADKVLVLGLLFGLTRLGLLPAWMMAVILVRELLISGVRIYAASCRVIIPAEKEGKHKAFVQMVTILIALTLLLIRERVAPGSLAGFDFRMHQTVLWCLWLTVALTVYSGAAFFWRNRSILADLSR